MTQRRLPFTVPLPAPLPVVLPQKPRYVFASAAAMRAAAECPSGECRSADNYTIVAIED